MTAKSRANALVLIGTLCDHATLRGINAQLRPKVDGGCVSYLSALTIADSARSLSDLKIFLTYGELGPETFTFRSVLELMLPWIGEQASPWEMELRYWQKLASTNELPKTLLPRRNWLQNTAAASEKIFLPGFEGRQLAIAPDFVLLDTSKSRELISQADVYAIVCNALAAVRSDDIGIETKTLRANPTPVWGQTVYAQSLLCPSSFS
ncbi:hypothetical protein ACSFBM_28750 [Variovorax sp. GB1R11]|uniref:hypothetical protein n=1 Tax=Variovorax sp. GB1R11 TaxID=3443741 RepID=UPI003F46B040